MLELGCPVLAALVLWLVLLSSGGNPRQGQSSLWLSLALCYLELSSQHPAEQLCSAVMKSVEPLLRAAWDSALRFREAEPAKLASYWQARYYHELGRTRERDEAAERFRQLT